MLALVAVALVMIGAHVFFFLQSRAVTSSTVPSLAQSASLNVHFDLSPPSLEVINLPFETHWNGDGVTVSRATYHHGGYGITDFGTIRVAVED